MTGPQAITRKLEEAIAFLQRGRLPEAVALFQDILAEEPSNFDALCLSAIALSAAGRPSDARGAIGRALALRPDSGDALNIQGDVLMALGDYQGAVESFRMARARNPLAPHVLNNLGNALSHAGSQEEAIQCFDAALALDPALAVVHYNRGDALRAAGRAEEAIAAYRSALRIEPGFTHALNNIASCLIGLGRLEDALTAATDATEARPGYARAWVNRGIALARLGREGDAIASLEAAVQRDANNAEAWYELARLRDAAGRDEDAIAGFRRAIAIDPGHSDAGVNLAICLLRCGRFAEGWGHYEHRLKAVSGLGPSRRIPRHPHPERLPGPEAVRGRRLLVMGEQGLGDEIMFASLIPDLSDLAAEVTVLADPRLAGLFSRSFPRTAVLAHGEAGPRVEAVPEEGRFMIGSLARLLRGELKDFPGTPYLVPDPARVAALRARLDALGPEKKVGVMWRGGVGMARERRRSLALADLLPLMARPAHWISLSHLAAAREETEALFRETGQRVHHWPEVTESEDYDDTAALLAALDAVISVTCTAAHCAGALGADTHVLVPERAEWRYGRDGSSIPWYGSMTLYRRQGDWPLPDIARAVWG
jgi:tetratricopeptide (TPR) repeat protein